MLKNKNKRKKRWKFKIKNKIRATSLTIYMNNEGDACTLMF
jgi:hypothetical protein